MTIICEPDAWAAQVLAAAIGGTARTAPALSRVPALLATVAGRCPVVVGASVDLEDALRFTAQLAAEHPDARVVLVRRQPVEAETVRATAAGVFAVVDVRAHDQIAHACSLAAQPDTEGQILTVFAAKAGYGKTTLATNLALALRADGARRVCLLDLDLDYGDVASALDLPTTRTLAQLIGPGTVGELVTSGELITTSERTGLDCILAPVAPGDAERIRPGRIGQLLRALVHRYDAVVVDLPARFSPTVLTALDSAHHHILVATPERPALKNLRQTLDILDLLGYSRAARSVLFNRSDSSAAITAAEVAAVVRGPIAAHVPSSRDVPASINQGVPLLAARPEHPVSVAIQRFAERYAPVLPASGDAGQIKAATAGLAARHTKGERMLDQLRKAREEESGFTLIELLIVVVILGVLAGIVVFAVSAFNNDGVKAACKSDIKNVEIASEAYYAKTGTWAATTAILKSSNYLKEEPSTDKYTINYTPGSGTTESTVTGTINGGGGSCTA